MRIHVLAISALFLFSVLTIAPVVCFGNRIHVSHDTIIVHAKRGGSNVETFGVSDGRKDTLQALQQGWDTVRVSLSGNPDFMMVSAPTITFLISAGISIKYSPSSLAPSNTVVTIVGDSNTLTVLLMGIPDTNFQCLSYREMQLPALPEGGSAIGVDSIFNLTDSTAIIDSITFVSGDTSDFTLLPLSFPLMLASHSSLPIAATGTIPIPATKQYYDATYKVWVHGTNPDGFPCLAISISFVAQLLIPTDTIIIDLPPIASDTIPVNVHAAISRHAIVVRNSSASWIYLTTMQITDTTRAATMEYPFGPHCTAYVLPPKTFCFDDTLMQGAGSDAALIMLQEQDTGTYPIDLAINFSYALQAQNYTILVHYTEPLSSVPAVSMLPSLDFTLNPNPALGEVTISLPDEINATVEIYDILGNLLLHKQASGQFVWDGGSNNMAPASGTYIVRVTERRGDGTVAISSKRLVFMR